jgi:hypothetical protein
VRFLRTFIRVGADAEESSDRRQRRTLHNERDEDDPERDEDDLIARGKRRARRCVKGQREREYE